MKLISFELSKEQLDSLTESERKLFFVLGHFANDINILTKLFLWCAETGDSTREENLGNTTQAMLLGRVLTGKLWEGWRLIKSEQLFKEYSPKFDKEEKEALSNLKAYFGRKNIINSVRNHFSFHYAPDEFEKAYAEGGFSDELLILLHTLNANTLYHFSEVVASKAMLDMIDASDPQAAFGQLISDTGQVTRWFNIIISACMFITVERFDLKNRDVVLSGLHDANDIQIPYFVEWPVEDD